MKYILLMLAAGAVFTAGNVNPSIAADAKQAEGLLKKNNCTQCHGIDKKIVGPAYKDVAKKYKGQQGAAAALAKKVKEGGKGVWGPVPMPPNVGTSEADIKQMIEFILSL